MKKVARSSILEGPSLTTGEATSVSVVPWQTTHRARKEARGNYLEEELWMLLQEGHPRS